MLEMRVICQDLLAKIFYINIGYNGITTHLIYNRR